jgi:ceramide glucosyltransferase
MVGVVGLLAHLPHRANLVGQSSAGRGKGERIVFIGMAAYWLLFGLTLAGIAFAGLAAALIRNRHHDIPSNAPLPSVTLLKPICGADVGLEDDLRSFFEQDYPGPLQIVCGLHSRSDPALAVVEKLAGEHSNVRVDIVIDPKLLGQNPKIANLINMLPRANGEILLLSDSDIRVPASYAKTVVQEILTPGTGAVTCLYRGRAASGWWSRIEAMGIDYGFLPNAIVGTALGLAKPCFGATIGFRLDTLAEIGGFEALSSHLADDYELGRAIRSKGHKVRLSSLVLQHTCLEPNLKGLFRHELRWARTIRLLDPAGYAGSIITHSVPLAILALALSSGIQGPILLCAALVARLWLAWCIRAGIGAESGPLWLLPLRDVLSFSIFLVSFLGNSVYWRGTRYETEANGLLAQQ